MPNRAKIHPLKFLVFLLPISLPLLFMIPASYNPVTYEWENTIAGIDVNHLIYAIAFIYPAVSALVFCKHRLLLWSPPMVFAAAAIVSAIFMRGSPNAFGMIFIVELAAIAWSLLCSLTAFFIRRIKQKGATPCV
ncbi:MAG: hypothetical protein FWE98_03700 [Oscillospiraceae bacterium]|nr:hypothetical protein [Oscillospiraceae bacterium]